MADRATRRLRTVVFAAGGAAFLAAGHGRAEPARTAQAEPTPEAEAPTVTVQGAPPPRAASETTIDRPVLDAAPHRTASDLLLVVPGVFVSQHGGEGKAHQIFFRGFDAVHGQDMELWVAGAPVNDVSNIHGQGYADLNFVMPEIVRTIQATPGTYDPRQGDFAVAGTLSYGLGYDEPGVTAKASTGSFGTRRFFLAYHPKDASEGTFAAFELYGTDGFGPSRAARRGSAIGQADFDLGRGVSLRTMASTYAGRFDSAGVLRLADIESGAVDRFATYDPKQGGASSRSQVVVEIGKETDDDAWAFSPFFVARALKLRSNFTGSLTGPEGDSIEQRNDANTVGLRASYHRRLTLFSEQDGIEAGIYGRFDSIEQSQHRLSTFDDRVIDTEQSPGVEAKVAATDAAGYLDLELHPIRRVTLRGGLRAESLWYLAEDRPNEAAGPTHVSQGALLLKRATVDVVPLAGLHVLASYGEGFRSPQARSLAEGETTPFATVVSYEAGVRYRESDRFEALVAVFHTDLSADLVFDPMTARNEPVPATSRTGVAASLGARPSNWLLTTANLTFARAEFSESGQGYAEGELLPYAPQAVARTDIAFTPTLGTYWKRELRAHVGAGATYVGRRPLPYGEFGHDVFLVDATARLRLREVELALDVYNVLDAEWFDGEFVYASDFSGSGNASLVPQRHVTVGPPRTALFTLTLFV